MDVEQTWPSARALIPALVTAITAGIISANVWLYLPRFVMQALHGVVILVPSIGHISAYLERPDQGLVVLTVQWLFLPWYVWVCFYRWAPWSAVMHRAVSDLAPRLSTGQRVLVPIAILLLSSLVASSIGLLHGPTFYNGVAAYPPVDAVPFVRPIYVSTAALVLYAFISPLAETLMWWGLAVLVVNFSTYMRTRHRAR